IHLTVSSVTRALGARLRQWRRRRPGSEGAAHVSTPHLAVILTDLSDSNDHFRRSKRVRALEQLQRGSVAPLVASSYFAASTPARSSVRTSSAIWSGSVRS